MQINLDFYTFLAYLIPGFISLKGITYYFSLPSISLSESIDLKLISTVLISAVVIGMMVSIVRAGTIDLSFNTPIWGNQEQSGKRERCDPNYSNLVGDHKLDIFKEAKIDDKRPYQFYGNCLLALTIFLSGYFFGKKSNSISMKLRYRIGIFIVSMLFLSLILYPASRYSHYRYMTTIENLTGCVNKKIETTRNNSETIESLISLSLQ